jgi:hypothetical protein
MFLDELEDAIEWIGERPWQFPECAFGTRRMAFKRFPYLIVFRETDVGGAFFLGAELPGMRTWRAFGGAKWISLQWSTSVVSPVKPPFWAFYGQVPFLAGLVRVGKCQPRRDSPSTRLSTGQISALKQYRSKPLPCSRNCRLSFLATATTMTTQKNPQ